MVTTLEGARVLIVDDVAVSRHLLERLLINAGAERIVQAGSAEEALGLLTDPAADPIDIVLLDIVLPGMDGLALVQRMKAHETLRDVPVIMVTDKSSAEDLRAGFEAGAVDYIAKPIRALELLARAGSALALKRESELRKRREQELEAAKAALEKANDALLALSHTDPLTGLANRRRLGQFLEDQFARAGREGWPISCLMADIDNFKAYNDIYGHQLGDQAIQQVAHVFAQHLRRPTDLAARYGGEELAGILAVTPLSGATAVAEATRQAVEDLCIEHVGSGYGHLTVSIGVGCIADPGQTVPESLLECADQALYRAKAQGRNRVCTSQRDRAEGSEPVAA